VPATPPVGANPLARSLDSLAGVRVPFVDYLPTFVDAAPLLSLLSFAIAIAGWRCTVSYLAGDW
jgi:hypothetical protein